MIIYKKHQDYDQEKNELLKLVRKYLNVEAENLDIYHIYLTKNRKTDEQLKNELFDLRYGSLVDEIPDATILIKDNDGQYIQIEDLTNKYLKNILNIDEEIRYIKGFNFIGLGQEDLERVKSYLINPVVQKAINLEDVKFEYEISDYKEMEEVKGFIDFDMESLKEYKENFGMDLDDLKFIQDHFKKEGRNPRFCELKMLDTYWSDHCRHTTFLTNLENVEIEEGTYKKEIENSYKTYQALRNKLYKDIEKPVTLMDIVTLKAKDLKERKILTDVEKSKEVNACSIEVDINVAGKKERWLHMFKNETHNHPTEIEPYGGAHTCIGGGIRDPLSGRAQVLQGIRLVGAGNPLDKYDDRIPGKLPQRYLASAAMNGFSDYANQIGSPVGIVREFYDEGFQAKRMELGALVAAVPKKDVLREDPIEGDLVLLLGAPTGRDGLGAAVGSSSVQTDKSLTKAGAEVQKGNPFAERKIIRLFNNKKATKLIKKSNDFGAGGVSVAIGELADGLDIYLDKVYLKYPGLNAYEVALSESQERMAVVIAQKDLDEFVKYLKEEDVRFEVVAKVTSNRRLKMYWNDKVVLDLSRDLLDSNGATKHMDVLVESNEKQLVKNEEIEKLNKLVTNNLSQNFDSSLGRNKIFMEYGGRYGLTQEEAIVTKFPVEDTDAVSVMSYAYYPQIGKVSSYHAGYYAVLQSIVKNIAITGKFDDIRLTMQEFFPSIKEDPRRMGIAFSSLLGAFEVMDKLDIPAIGGKDSMSGSFKDIDVPPSLICFAVNVSSKDRVVSREFKKPSSYVYMTNIALLENGLIDFNSFTKVMKKFSSLHKNGQVLAASAVSQYGISFTIDDMGLGNGLSIENKIDLDDKFMVGNIVFEVSKELNDDHFIFLGKTKKDDRYKEVLKDRSGLLDEVYEDIREEKSCDLEKTPFKKIEIDREKFGQAKVLIPVLDGATGEYDLDRAMKKAGFTTEQFVIKTENNKLYTESIKELADKIDQNNIIVLPHGDYIASVVKNISGFLVKVLGENRVKEAIERLLDRKGFVIGIGAGMSALIDGNYFGPIKNDLIFRTNKNNKYISAMQDVRIIRNSYISGEEKIYTAPISGRSISLECNNLEKLDEYIDIISVNYPSILGDCSIDSIQDKSGHVIGIRSLVERMDKDLYRNIEVKGHPSVFEELRKYFN